MQVTVSDSGAGVRFVRIFGDTANNTRNPTRVSESDTGAGYPTRQKNVDTGVRVTQAEFSASSHSVCHGCLPYSMGMLSQPPDFQTQVVFLMVGQDHHFSLGT